MTVSLHGHVAVSHLLCPFSCSCAHSTHDFGPVSVYLCVKFAPLSTVVFRSILLVGLDMTSTTMRDKSREGSTTQTQGSSTEESVLNAFAEIGHF